MRTREMSRMTWVEVKEAIDQNYGVILPIGSTEQHGYHLPISTDAIIATTLSLEVTDESNMLVAPPITYGYRSRPLSGGGQAFAGTTSLSGKTLMLLVEDILEEFVRQGFRRIALLSWHMENQNFIYESAYIVSQRHPDIKIIVMESPFDKLSDETMELVFGGDFPGWAREHAAIQETSMMLYRYPELVLLDRAVNDRTEEYPFYEVLPIQKHYYPVSGSLWKAREASAQKGERVWKEIVEIAKQALKKELPV